MPARRPYGAWPAPGGRVIAAGSEECSCGRGRRGRSWLRSSSWSKSDDDPEQPERADGHDRERYGEQHFDTSDHHSPVDSNSLLRDRRIPAARLVGIDGSIMASCLRPIPLFCAFPHTTKSCGSRFAKVRVRCSQKRDPLSKRSSRCPKYKHSRLLDTASGMGAGCGHTGQTKS
jgi:hypothetical protein